jgi:hypothetical protein
VSGGGGRGEEAREAGGRGALACERAVRVGHGGQSEFGSAVARSC